TRVVAPAGADFEVYPGERFSIEGTNLEGSSLAVYFAHNGKDLAQVTQRGDTLIWAIAPPDLVPGNTYALYVANERGVSNPVQVKAQGSSAARPSITVLSPNGGESFGVGDRMVITWNTGNFPANARVAIQLAQKIPNGYYGQAPIALDTPNTGRFEWLIPTTIPVSTHYAVSIQGPNGGEEGKGAQDYSNNEFSISGGEPIVIEVSPNSVPIGGTVRVTVDTTRAGITGEIGAVLVQLYSLDDQQYIPNKWATKSSVANQWFADFAVPSTVTPGTWKVMGVDVFNNDSVQKIVGKYQHGFEINKTFTITAPASSGGGSGGGGAATIGLSPGNDYCFRGPVALQQLSDGGFMLSSTPANRPDELFFFANNPPAATDSASDTYYRLQDGNWYKVGGGVTVIDASTQTSSYFVVRKNSLYAGSVLTLPSSVTYFGSTVMNASPRPWQ
ncbi:MAG: hypothetical protein HYZ07_00495, partial [Candidatus Harrisonbacteria bacterium]|nr:hypothetical protein [Candidatus Harrisonbacteria bacterium]